MVGAAASTVGSRQMSLARTSAEGPWVRGDLFGLERVLEILLQNAVQHTTADGRIEINVDSDGDTACVEVGDDGEGIPPEHQARVFDRFYRVDASRSRENGNAGLGLAIAKAIVNQHGGSISVCSEPGKGSTFRVGLPVVSAGL
jgi:signal transduction histidine kinase